MDNESTEERGGHPSEKAIQVSAVTMEKKIKRRLGSVTYVTVAVSATPRAHGVRKIRAERNPKRL
jgi:hypothetical protein